MLSAFFFHFLFAFLNLLYYLCTRKTVNVNPDIVARRGARVVEEARLESV